MQIHDARQEAARRGLSLPPSSHWKMGPPPSPNRTKYPYVGTMVVAGLPVYVEVAAGQLRHYGKGQACRFAVPYGEIPDTLGEDGDPVDVFLGPEPGATIAYVIRQQLPGETALDEIKVFLGFKSESDARKAYLSHYDSPGFFRSLTAWPVAHLKEHLRKMGRRKAGPMKAEHRSNIKLLVKANPELVAWRAPTIPLGGGGYSIGKGPKGISQTAPNYRRSLAGDDVCSRCRFALKGECVSYAFRFEKRHVCDAHVPVNSWGADYGDGSHADPESRQLAAMIAWAEHVDLEGRESRVRLLVKADNTPKADYFRKVGGHDIPFTGTPGRGKQVGGFQYAEKFGKKGGKDQEPDSGITFEPEGRRVYVTGDTYDLRQKLKAYDFKWDRDQRKWWAGKSKAGADVQKELHAHAREINKDKKAEKATATKLLENPPAGSEIAFHEVNGKLYASGKTYALKDKFKAKGFRWDAGRKQWGAPKDRAMQGIEALHEASLFAKHAPQKGGGGPPRGGASVKQVDFADMLVRRAQRSGAWHDSDSGQGMSAPSRAQISAMSRSDISALITDMKDVLPQSRPRGQDRFGRMRKAHIRLLVKSAGGGSFGIGTVAMANVKDSTGLAATIPVAEKLKMLKDAEAENEDQENDEQDMGKATTSTSIAAMVPQDLEGDSSPALDEDEEEDEEMAKGVRLLVKGVSADPELLHRRAIEWGLQHGHGDEVRRFTAKWRDLAEQHARETLIEKGEASFDGYLDERDRIEDMLSKASTRERLLMAELVTPDGVQWRTGSPVTFRYAHNLASSDFQRPEQDVEPSGVYMIHQPTLGGAKFPTWETGTAAFNNPLVVEWGSGLSDAVGWRARLSQHFGGKTGYELARALRLKGHDGVVTVRPHWKEVAEIVDLRRLSKLRKAISGLLVRG